MTEQQHMKRLVLHGFRGHPDTVLDLSPGLNVLWGVSDAGKSAIKGGIEWGVFNTPTGDDMRPRWDPKGECVVEMTFANGNDSAPDVVVERGRSGPTKGGKNWYKLNGEEFTAFGTGVPQEVAQAVNMTSVNFSDQLGGLFMLADSPQQIAKTLRDNVGLQDADVLLRGFDIKTRRLQTAVRTGEADVERLVGALAELPDVDEADRWLSAAEGHAGEVDRLTVRRDRLVRMTAAIKNVRAALDRVPDLKHVAEQLAMVREVGQEVEELERQRDALVGMVDAVHEAQDSLLIVEGVAGCKGLVQAVVDLSKEAAEKAVVLGRLCRDVDAALDARRGLEALEPVLACVPLVAAAEAAMVAVRSADTQLFNLSRMVDSVNMLQKRVDDAEVAYQQAKMDRDKRLEGVLCPTCGQPWPKERI